MNVKVRTSLDFYFNYFDDTQPVGQWESGRWVGGLSIIWSVG